MDEANHNQYFKGFVLEKDGKICGGPQFVVHCGRTQDALVEIETPPGSLHQVRFLLIHQTLNNKITRAVGFTDHKKYDEGSYCFGGRLTVGRMFFVPVAVRVDAWRETERHPMHTALVESTGDGISLTPEGFDHADDLFNILDVNGDWYLSRAEICVFKQLLGYSFELSDDEWDDITHGWQEGDIGSGGISPNLFQSLLIRLAEETFHFNEKPEDGRHQRESVGIARNRSNQVIHQIDEKLHQIFLQFGIADDEDNFRDGVTPYVVCLSYAEGGVSPVQCVSKERVPMLPNLAAWTSYRGTRWSLPNANFDIFLYKAPDWCSISLYNFANEEETVLVECLGSKNAVPKNKGLDGIIWKGVLKPKQQQNTPQPPCVFHFFMAICTLTAALLQILYLLFCTWKTWASPLNGRGDITYTSSVCPNLTEDEEFTDETITEDEEPPSRLVGAGDS